MLRIVVRWLLLACALLLVAQVVSGITIGSFGAAMVAALVLGLLNLLLRPLLLLLTLPVTVLTLGLFIFVINALIFQAAAWLFPGLGVAGFRAALLGSLLYSLCALVIEVAIGRLFERPA